MGSLVLPVVSAAVAALVAGLSVPAIRRWTLARGAVVESRADRWHAAATPAFGGVGIVGAVLAGTAAAALASGRMGAAELGSLELDPALPGLLSAGLLMFLTGLVDDVRELRPSTKLTLQLVAAALLVSTGFVARATGVAGVDVVLSMAWCVAITNALNLLDNMNGLAGGVAAIASACLGVLMAWDGMWLQAVWAFALTGACLGFLVHNYPRARIFMGDSGSLFIGVSLAALGLSSGPNASVGFIPAMAVPVLVLSVPILDTVLVTVSRLAEGRPVSRGGRDHASHRLVASGMAERRAVRLLWLFAGVSGAVALALRSNQRPLAVLLGGVVLLGLTTIAFHLLGIQVRERAGGRTWPARILAADLHWPALAIALDVVAIAVAYHGAYLLRWDGADLARELVYFRQTLAVVIASKVVAFGVIKVYGSPLRHISLEEGERLVVANLVGSGVAFVAAVMLFGFGFSRGILVMDFLMCLALTLGYRCLVRILDRQGAVWPDDAADAVIIGSERDAVLVLDELRVGGIRALRPVCVLDPGGHGATGHLRGLRLRSGLDGGRSWLARNPVAAAFVVRRDGCLTPPVSDLVEECLALGTDVHFLDVSLRLNGRVGTVTVGRPAATSPGPVGSGRGPEGFVPEAAATGAVR